MKERSLNIVWQVCAGFLALSLVNLANGQETGFADDFSSDSVTWNTRGNGFSSARGENGAIVLQADSSAGNFSQRRLPLLQASDSLLITGTIDPATDLAADFNDQAKLRVAAVIFNDIAPGGDPNHPRGNYGGNVGFGIDYFVGGDGSTGAVVCFGREGENGFEGYNVFGVEEFCRQIEPFSNAVGTPVTLGYSLNRDTNVITFTANDQSLEVTLPGDIYPAFDAESNIELESQNTADATARITRISTSASSVDFSSTTPIIDRYQANNFDENNPGSIEVLDGTAQLVAVSADDGYSSTQLSPRVVTDYLEAEMMLSSDSLMENGRIYAQLEAEIFNDTGDGGTDGRLGEVRSLLAMRADADGQRNVEYCLFRSDDSDFDARSGLLENGERCQYFPTRIELDTAYRMAMELDRNASTITFRFAGFTHVHNISGAIFLGANPRYDARLAANDGATAVGTIDNLRTAPAALTNDELAAGLTAPDSFPDPVDPADLAVDSSLTAPSYDFGKELSFVDDFSNPESTALGYWSNSRRGEGDSALRFVNGSLELQANRVGADGDNNTYSELYINGRTNSLRASISLSSETLLPPDPNAEAQFQVRAVFHNDIQDFGTTNQREGDVPVTIQLRLRGDGRFRAEYYLGRRDANGDWQNYDIIDGENGGAFSETAISLDAVYDVALVMDREQGVLTLSFEDISVDVPLPTAAFEAHSAEAVIQVNHRGTSGRSIGRVHSIETDNYKRDFSTGSGTLGPYAPMFNSRFPGQQVSNDNGRLKLISDRTQFESNSNALFLAGGSDFIGAEVMLSSESLISAGSSARAGVVATLYNDFAVGGDNVGRTYAEMHIEAESPDSVYAEYCVIRSNDDNFSDTTEIITGTPVTDGPLDCSRFELAVALDVTYPMSIDFDREAGVIRFKLGDEQRDFTIATEIFDIARPYNAIVVHASNSGRSVAYFDNLSLSENPVALGNSNQTLVVDTDTSGGGGSASSGSGGSSGGCSISGNSSGSPLFILFVIVATMGIWRRRFLSPRR